jgi:ribonuclease HI
LRDCRAKANLDLVERLRQLVGQHKVMVEHVPGHSGSASAGLRRAAQHRP